MSQRILWEVAPGAGVPIYRQIVEQVKGAIASGLLGPDAQLPTHRDLAAELLVAPLTVKKAYDVLLQEGLIVSGRGRGTFVASTSAAVRPDALRALEERSQALVRQARILGLTEKELVKSVLQAWRAGTKGMRT